MGIEPNPNFVANKIHDTSLWEKQKLDHETDLLFDYEAAVVPESDSADTRLEFG